MTTSTPTTTPQPAHTAPAGPGTPSAPAAERPAPAPASTTQPPADMRTVLIARLRTELARGAALNKERNGHLRALRADNTRLTADNTRLEHALAADTRTVLVARLRTELARGAALNKERNGHLRALRADNARLNADNTSLKADNTRLEHALAAERARAAKAEHAAAAALAQARVGVDGRRLEGGKENFGGAKRRASCDAAAPPPPKRLRATHAAGAPFPFTFTFRGTTAYSGLSAAAGGAHFAGGVLRQIVGRTMDGPELGGGSGAFGAVQPVCA
ncbi:hypothetical protein PsYK624_097810 [Phanerochaete sordida]|uniref:Uncharacterized protein n=1 Tax=Phanerochaete sordida TaxID=48140 RepID=A0A9P3GEV7_9APHY|nr:hypothetical protein PsYK624_097810 [Phanerochaete sordida]